MSDFASPTLKEQFTQKVKAEYQDFIDKIVQLTPQEVVARCDVIADYHRIVTALETEDFNPGDHLLHELLGVDWLLDDILEFYRLELNDDEDLQDAVYNAVYILGGKEWAEESSIDGETEDDFDMEP